MNLGGRIMKNLLNYVPGFRTGRTWKKVVASIYYLFCLLISFAGIGAFLICASIPIILFSVIRLIRNKKERSRVLIIILAVSIFAFVGGVNLDSIKTKKDLKVASELKVANDKKAAEVAAIKAISDKKAAEDKLIADKLAAEQKIIDDKLAIEKAKTDKETARLKVIEDKKIVDAKIISDKKAAEAKIALEKKEAKEKLALEAKAKKDSQKALYDEWVTSQFSAWNGSNIYLVDLIKENLNDNKSFKHVSTTYSNHGTYLTIFMVYRASNAFGATILQNVTAKSDYKTNIISVIAQNTK